MVGDDGEWKYSIEEVGDEGDGGNEENERDDAGLLDRQNDKEGEKTRQRIEPGTPAPENVLFVVIGVLIAVGTIVYGLGLL